MSPSDQSCSHCSQTLPPEARFCTQCGSPAPPGPTIEERRHLTVMFCDLVADPPLAEQLEPEALVQVIQRYHRMGAEVIRRFSGHIAQYLGDGLLVFFGYPQAYEDNALRAVRASWQLLQELERLNRELEREYGVSLAARIGIHSGPIVVANIGDTRQHRQAFGRSMNLSARLQGIASPNRIVLSRDTLRLLGDAVHVRDLGMHELKGIENPIAAFEVIRPLSNQEFIRREEVESTSQIVGRDRELELLLDRWEDVCRGRGQVVAITGEAGIGKTRLVSALRAAIASDPYAFAQAQGSAYHRFSSLYPVAELLPQTLGLDLSLDSEIDLEQVRAPLRGTAVEDAAPLFAQLLELQTDAPRTKAERRNRSSDVVRESLLAALTEWLLSFGGELPTLLVLEDLHEVDPSTLELLDRMIQRVPANKMLLIVTARPGEPSYVPRESFVTTLELRPLSRTEAQVLLERRAGNRALPAALVNTLVERTDGLPLFVEELTKMVLESDSLDGTEPPLPGGLGEAEASIPTTLQDSLMARLDRLSDAKRVAQTAAVLGREFSRRLLEALLDEPPARINEALDRLVKAEILEQHGDAPNAVFAFRHALLQEAAYHSLLRRTRQTLHERTAEILEQQLPNLHANAPELLAHHYEQAGRAEQAIVFWQRAGQRALATSAIREAKEHFERALAGIGELPPGRERDQRELLPQAGLVVALFTSHGYAASEVQRAVERAIDLSRGIPWNPITAFVHQLQITYLTTRGAYADARRRVTQLIEAATLAEDETVVLRARAVLGQALVFQGDFAVAQTELEEALHLRELEPSGQTALTRGVDTTLMSLGWLSWTHHFRGQFSESIRYRDTSLREAASIDHPYSVAFAALQASTLSLLRSEPDQAEDHATRALTLSRRYRFSFCEAWAVALRGWILLLRSDLEAGAAEITRGLALWDALETQIGRSIWLSLRGAAWAFGSAPERGLALIQSARDDAEEGGEGIFLSELDRLIASILLVRHRATRDPDLESPTVLRAESLLRRALACAVKQNARWSQLRCATDLASLIARRGEETAAISLLENALAGLKQADAPGDLSRAQRLLDRLRH